MDLLEALTSLTGACAPSGYINEASECARRLLMPLVNEVCTDQLDNVIGVRRSSNSTAPKILLDAHLDEIGFIVTGHENGYLRFHTLGGVDARMLPGRELTMMTDPIGFGVIAAKPPHVLSQEERNHALDVKDLFIDVGLTQDEAVQCYPVGTTAVFRAPLAYLMNHRVTAKALDNRACFCVILRTLELLQTQSLPYELWILGSNMEENGGVGGATGAYAINPDCAVILDVTFATQNDVSERNGFALGCGPAIGVGPSVSSWMTDIMMNTAERHGIPFQIEVMSGHSGTNCDKIQIVREGIATQVLSVPIRYMHTPVETVDLNDIEATARLLAEFLIALGEEMPECLNY